MTERTVFLMGEEAPSCPHCGRRLVVGDEPVDRDQDGLIFAASCDEHGTMLVQDAPEDEEDEDEQEDA